jgi:ATP-dependent Clp protease ATP-binding subunit ClpA
MLGVSMFERFTEQARNAIVLAQEEARGLKHNYIGTEHMLLGLLRDRDSLAARVLQSFGIDLEAARVQVSAAVGVGEEVVSGQVPFTPRSKKVLELALKESQALGRDYIGTEHLLLGLAREGEGVAMRVLTDSGVSAQLVRETVVDALGNPLVLESRSRDRLLARAALVDVHLQVSQRFAEVAAIIASAENEEAAIAELQSGLEITDAQARWILNSDLRRFTRAQTQASIAMREEIQRALEALGQPPDD